ncbi:putative phosphoinositide phosphatase, partial [Pseudoloma neurophilia]
QPQGRDKTSQTEGVQPQGRDKTSQTEGVQPQGRDKISARVISSFLQLRGSIPLSWRQDLTFKYTPNIKILKTAQPLLSYHGSMVNVYNSIFYLNLIKSVGYESALNMFYCKCLQDNNLKYLHYDFAREGLSISRKKRRELILLLRPLLRRNRVYLNEGSSTLNGSMSSNNGSMSRNNGSMSRNNGSLSSNNGSMSSVNMNVLGQNSSISFNNSLYPSNTHFSTQTDISSHLSNNSHFMKDKTLKKEKISYQQGIIRTNCIDSLDRTNIVQFFIGEEMIREQVNNISDLNIELDDFHKNFKELWIRNGHRLSKQYSGTNSLGSGAVSNDSGNNSDIKFIIQNNLLYCLRKLNDGKHSIVRYFINRFTHGHLQTTYDIITGQNHQMFKRSNTQFSFFHSFICCMSVLFYSYYFLFYFGQKEVLQEKSIFHGYMSEISKKMIDKITELSKKLLNQQPISHIYNDNNVFYMFRKGIFYFKVTFLDLLKRYLPIIIQFILFLHGLIPITFYDLILITLLSTVITLILYYLLMGHCFNQPFYE